MRYDISVITPLYNGINFLPDYLNLIHRKSSLRIEYIIIDDCSNDGGIEYLRQNCNLKNFKLIRLKQNSGPAIARNVGIKNSAADYVAFLDVDDFWSLDKLAKQLFFMKSNKISISYTDFIYVNNQLTKRSDLIKCPDSINWFIHHTSRYIVCSSVMVKKMKNFKLTFKKTKIDYFAEDFLLWSDFICFFGPIKKVPGVITYYRVSDHSRSSNYFYNGFRILSLYKNIESINFFESFFYFFCYLFFSIYKKTLLLKFKNSFEKF
jgi:teichuronic acid biosynthesis glycosyltransferase TuaG